MRKYDMSQFRAHCAVTAELSGYAQAKQANEDYLLRFWYKNKNKFLYKLMGEELILSKEIRYERSLDELTSTLTRTLRHYRTFEEQFWGCLHEELYKIHPCWDNFYSDSLTDAGREANRFNQSLSESMDYYNLCDGARIRIRYRPGTSTTTVATTICGQEVVLSAGQKVMKVIGKLANMFGLSEEFEAYRIAHSQALNQKIISGKLHLSIHPLDYATASDNNNGWDSCMSWYNNGCYRLGTIEMMNSPCVICAYLTGKNVMEDVGGGEWNSKKWRAWVIVDKEIIAMNRQYPYDNKNLAKSVLDWVADLASTNLDWEYEPFENEYLYSHHGFYFECGYMYNDFAGECPARVRADSQGKDIYFSGPANCMWCGEAIPVGVVDAGTTVCNNCNDVTHCTCCGEYVREDDILWGPNDMPYCYDCYHERFTECNCCNKIIDNEDTINLDIPFDECLWQSLVNNAPHNSTLYRYYMNFCTGISMPHREITLCRNCMQEFGIVDEDILYNVEIPFEYYQLPWDQHFSRGNILDPRKVTCEQACNAYNLSMDKSIREAWQKIWQDYTETLYTHGIISHE